MNTLIPTEKIERSILLIREQKVIIDSDLAILYGISTKALNQAIKRNQDRFPIEFAFQLRLEEKIEVVTICDHLKNLKYSSTLPYAFTEHGALMAATVLNSKIATDMSILIIKSFISLRNMFKNNEDLLKYIKDLEREYNTNFMYIFQTLDKLKNPPIDPNKSPVGFNAA